LLLLATDATISCKILVKIGPVVLAENILIEIVLRVHVVVQHMSSIISGCTRPIFAIFPLYESTLHADDRSVPYSAVCQETLPWQPNNFTVMKVNIYYVHSLQFARWSTVLFCYYLLGGDTVVPSELLARFCLAHF